MSDFDNLLAEFTREIELVDDSIWSQGAERVVDQLNARIGSETQARFSWKLEGDNITLMVAPYVLYQNYGVQGAKSSYMGVRYSEVDERYYAYDSSNPRKRPYHKIFMEAYGLSEGEAYGASDTVYKFGIPPKDWFSLNEGPGINIQDTFVREVQEYINNLA